MSGGRVWGCLRGSLDILGHGISPGKLINPSRCSVANWPFGQVCFIYLGEKGQGGSHAGERG